MQEACGGGALGGASMMKSKGRKHEGRVDSDKEGVRAGFGGIQIVMELSCETASWSQRKGN